MLLFLIKKHLFIVKNGEIILNGFRNLGNGLWDVPFKEQGIDKINYIINRDRSKIELAQYLHGYTFSPFISTLQEYIRRGNFTTWPGIEQLNFKKLIKTTETTLKGHLY